MTHHGHKLPKDYHALAERCGFSWLGPEVPLVSIKTKWLCKNGHDWEAPYNALQQGKGCPVCAYDARRRTPADYHALAAERSFCWLGPEVRRVSAKTEWQCEHGHHWEAPYNALRQGKGCPVCAYDARRRTSVDYHALAAERSFCWLGPEVRRVSAKTEWQCEHGHQWKASYNAVRKGRNCPICSLNARRRTPADYYALAQARGFCWLGPEVQQTSVKTEWQCQQGHQWEAPYNAIYQGRGCPICADKARRKTPADYHTLAAARNFCWLGPETTNNHTRTWWECEYGHQWEASYNVVYQGKSCPVCRQSGSPSRGRD